MPAYIFLQQSNFMYNTRSYTSTKWDLMVYAAVTACPHTSLTRFKCMPGMAGFWCLKLMPFALLAVYSWLFWHMCCFPGAQWVAIGLWQQGIRNSDWY